MGELSLGFFGLFCVDSVEVNVFAHVWCQFEEVSDCTFNVFGLGYVSAYDEYVCAFF